MSRSRSSTWRLAALSALALEPPSDPVVQTVPEHQRRKPVRKPFPDDLPSVDIDIVPV